MERYKTKIVCTIGPATREPEILRRLMKAGMDVCRLNFSHGTHEEHAQLIADIRACAREVGVPMAILQDLAGPKIRTGPMAPGTVELVAGRTIVLTSRDVPGSATEVGLTWPDLPDAVQPGDTVYLADGLLALEVVSNDGTDVACTVVTGGELGSHKGINLPGRTLDVPSLTEKDEMDLRFGLAQGVDYVALSFVRSAADVEAAQAIISAEGCETPVIAKIEKFEALDNIDEIVAVSGGLMVARGDLGVEIPLELVPRAQKMLIAKANAAAIPVITATQMLRSMVDNPRPTRAEVSDVANAILDGTDAVMLSEETAMGKHPVKAVQVMHRVAADVELDFDHASWIQRHYVKGQHSFEAAVAHSAVRMADDIGATAIITSTKSGSTTRKVARYRPRQKLLSMTTEPATANRMALVFGADPILTGEALNGLDLERVVIRAALERGFVKKGDAVVITAGLPFDVTGTTNLIKVSRVGDPI
jgi:pyruvate kinase